ncbi:MAG: hypothetical protein ABL901_17270 [Hyphomicrobiaceae bacterium]
MSYGDMVRKLYPKEPIDKPSALDAVHALKPITMIGSSYFPWLDSTEAETQNTVNGEYRHTILHAARPVPKELVPEWIRIKGYRRPRKWPDGLAQAMPDFFSLTQYCYCVSHEARELLDQLAPNTIEYIEVLVETPPEMQCSSAYYFINVLPQARQLDWGMADVWKWKPNQVLQMLSENSRNVVFKPMAAGDPAIWHELSLDNDRHQSDQRMVLLRGTVWNELIERFPFQLTQQCLTDPRVS